MPNSWFEFPRRAEEAAERAGSDGRKKLTTPTNDNTRSAKAQKKANLAQSLIDSTGERLVIVTPVGTQYTGFVTVAL